MSQMEVKFHPVEPVAEAPAKTSEQEKFYHFFLLAMTMAVITSVELVIIYLPFWDWFILTGVVVLSIVKFVGVITWFMHLIYDKAILTFIFLSGLIIAGGTVTALLLLMSEHEAIPIGGEDQAALVETVDALPS